MIMYHYFNELLLSIVVLVFISAMEVSGIGEETAAQDVLTVYAAQWRIHLARDWDVLGPFPIHAREQHFLSPGFPLDLSPPYVHEPNRVWPSSYAPNALVTWSKTRSDADGNLVVSFPAIRWETLRATEGWSALQYHAVLHTTLTVHPPPRHEDADRSEILPPRLLVELKQGSYFALIPREKDERASVSFSPEWHAGNIYDLHRAPANAVELPGTVSFDKPSTYDLFVSGDYEIRLFGDPRDQGERYPTLKLSVSTRLEPKIGYGRVERYEQYDLSCDFVDGFAFGDALGVGVHAIEGSWSAARLDFPLDFPREVSLSLPKRTVVSESQTVTIPIKLSQTARLDEKTLEFSIVLLSEDVHGRNFEVHLPVTLYFRQLHPWTDTAWEAVRATFFFATSHPTVFLAKPPMLPRDEKMKAGNYPVVALHGAGVDILSSPFWANAIPRQKYSWIIMPTGRTEWGLDWHGPSAAEAWTSVAALSELLSGRLHAWGFQPDTKVVLLGHSNGGQGVWYLASRFPDRVQAAIPAAGYIKSQAYVPLIHSKSSHFIDPSLRSVLESSLTPDDNDLHLSNLAGIPIFAIHGGNDTNVPTWHSRELFSIAKDLGDGLDITFHEDPGKPHWYPEVITGEHVQSFLDRVFESDVRSNVTSFTMTVSDPAHSGPMFGWKVVSLRIPGRLGRVRVRVADRVAYIQTSNVKALYGNVGALGGEFDIVLNGEMFTRKSAYPEPLAFELTQSGTWVYNGPHPPATLTVQPNGRVQNILNSSGPLLIVIPSKDLQRPCSVALRIAHNLDVYLRLDAEITTDRIASQLLSEGLMPEGNIVVIGGPSNSFAQDLLSSGKTGISLRNGIWSFRGKNLFSLSYGLLFTHPHPTNPAGLVLFLDGSDDDGLERALRLFPFRTGVAAPDWIIIGNETDRLGAAGVLGAGVWYDHNDSWEWNEAMSWTS